VLAQVVNIAIKPNFPVPALLSCSRSPLPPSKLMSSTRLLLTLLESILTNSRRPKSFSILRKNRGEGALPSAHSDRSSLSFRCPGRLDRSYVSCLREAPRAPISCAAIVHCHPRAHTQHQPPTAPTVPPLPSPPLFPEPPLLCYTYSSREFNLLGLRRCPYKPWNKKDSAGFFQP
jgi:hypothetical protein